MSRQAIKRIAILDMKMCDKMDLGSHGIHVHFDEQDITKATAMIIGPQGTPYEDGMLFFRIRFPQDYPFSPPKVSYVSTSRLRIHPNLYVGKPSTNYEGKVCLSSLNTWSGPKWTSAMNIGSILITLQSILDENPLRNEPGYEEAGLPTKNGSATKILNKTYNLIVQHDTFRNLILKNSREALSEDTECFREAIQQHMALRLPYILKNGQRMAEAYPKPYVASVGTYHLNERLDFPKVTQELRGMS